MDMDRRATAERRVNFLNEEVARIMGAVEGGTRNRL
jgi:hypothetical protein